MKRLMTTVLFAVFAIFMSAQIQDPVHFSVAKKQVSPSEIDIVFTGKIDAGWHVYSVGMPADGPVSAAVKTEKAQGVVAQGKLTHKGKELAIFDNMFGMKVRYFENNVQFIQRYVITAENYHVKGYLEYGACNDENCMPPTTVDFDFTGKGPADTVAKYDTPEPSNIDSSTQAQLTADTISADTIAKDTTGLWTPVIN